MGLGIHNENEAALGTTTSNVKEVTNRKGSIAAGTAVRLKSDGTIVTTKADGQLLGISIGHDQSGIGRTAIAVKGLGVPLRLTTGFTPTLGTVVYIDDATGLAKGSATDATAVNAYYAKALDDGAIPEDGGSNVRAVLVDFPGGL